MSKKQLKNFAATTRKSLPKKKKQKQVERRARRDVLLESQIWLRLKNKLDVRSTFLHITRAAIPRGAAPL